MRLRVGLAVIGLMVFAGCTGEVQVQRSGGTTMTAEASTFPGEESFELATRSARAVKQAILRR